MKTLWLILAAAPVCALNAQTNLPGPEFPAATNAAAARASTNKPARESQALDIKSDISYFDFKNRVCVFTNHVVATNAQMKLTCDVLTAELPQTSEGKFNRVAAERNVVMDFLDDKGQNNRVTAEKAVYTDSITNWISGGITNSITNNIVILTGNPVLTNAEGTHRGDPIIWDRIKNTVLSKNQETIIHPTGTNALDFLNSSSPVKTNSTQVKPAANPK